MIDIDRKAPVQSEARLVTSASPQAVYGVLLDLPGWSRIYPDLRDLEADGPTAVGTAFRFKSGPMQVEAKITALEEDSLLAFDGGGRGASSTYVFRLSPSDEGTQLHVEQSMSGMAVKTMKPMLQKIADTSLQDWAAAIAKAAEGS